MLVCGSTVSPRTAVARQRLVLEYMDGGDLQGLIARRRDVEAIRRRAAREQRAIVA